MFSSNTFVATFFFLISLLCGVRCCEVWIQFYPVPRTYEIPTFLVLNSLVHSIVCLKGWDIISDVSLFYFVHKCLNIFFPGSQ